MIWQDIVILGAQLLCLAAMLPTLRDRKQWPHRLTCWMTSAALSAMCIAFGTLGLWLSATITFALSVIWLRMFVR